MKPLYILILIPFLSFAQEEKYSFTKNEIDTLYEIGKRYEWYRENYPKRINDIDNLHSIIIQQDTTLQGYIRRTVERDKDLKKMYELKEKYSVQQAKRWNFWDWTLFIGSNILTGYLTYKLTKG